ncbi:uncharacterized protein LOC141855789 [Brevipalpus obovatus]|uniref:uncharacterized protein LOC141855789 n=1 Tax=Brevipalpus obovatus TaxID=246614 RepID=UPI003D9F6E0C
MVMTTGAMSCANEQSCSASNNNNNTKSKSDLSNELKNLKFNDNSGTPPVIICELSDEDGAKNSNKENPPEKSASSSSLSVPSVEINEKRPPLPRGLSSIS